MLLLALVLSYVPAFGYAAIVYWIDRYEKEPVLLLGGGFIWGAVVAVIGAIFWSLVLQGGIYAVTGSENTADFLGTTVIAPVVEETTKGLAVLIVFLAFRREFDSILDGIVYAGIVALGFAATENVLYLSSAADEGGLGGLLVLFVLRVLLGGWNHAVYTAFTGIGLALARQSRGGLMRFAAPAVGLLLAMLAHSLHNTMATLLAEQGGFGGLAATLLVDWLSWVSIGSVIVWAVLRERRWIVTQLREEVEQGTISPGQYQVACSLWGQTGARLGALFGGRYRLTRRFYQLCGELAQKKQQQQQFGDEAGNSAIIAGLRSELARLAPAVA